MKMAYVHTNQTCKGHIQRRVWTTLCTRHNPTPHAEGARWLTRRFSRSMPWMLAVQEASDTLVTTRWMATGMLRKNASGTQGGVMTL